MVRQTYMVVWLGEAMEAAARVSAGCTLGAADSDPVGEGCRGRLGRTVAGRGVANRGSFCSICLCIQLCIFCGHFGVISEIQNTNTAQIQRKYSKKTLEIMGLILPGSYVSSAHWSNPKIQNRRKHKNIKA
jgi:hypothetical protein